MKTKLYLTGLLFIITIFSCKKGEIIGTGPFSEMEFKEKEFDFGKLNQGDKVSTTFEFANPSATALQIKEAHGSCGCTVPEYPKTPIQPGKTGKIKVSFNSAGKQGSVKKTVTLLANTKSGVQVLTIYADVQTK